MLESTIRIFEPLGVGMKISLCIVLALGAACSQHDDTGAMADAAAEIAADAVDENLERRIIDLQQQLEQADADIRAARAEAEAATADANRVERDLERLESRVSSLEMQTNY